MMTNSISAHINHISIFSSGIYRTKSILPTPNVSYLTALDIDKVDYQDYQW